MIFYQFPTPLIAIASGADCRRYLNARLTNDANKVAIGSHMVAAALTPQGRAQGLFLVHRTDENDFLLICDSADNGHVLEALKKYIVADRVTIISKSGEYLLFHVETDKIDLLRSDSSLHATIINTKRIGANGYHVIVPTSAHEAFTRLMNNQKAKELSSEEYHCLRIKEGIAAFPDEINEEYFYSAFGIENSISFNKGCYVGQEVVERSDAIGKLPYFIKHAVFDGKVHLSSDAPLFQPETEAAASTHSVGKVISFCYDKNSDKTYALVEIRANRYTQAMKLKLDGSDGQLLN